MTLLRLSIVLPVIVVAPAILPGQVDATDPLVYPGPAWSPYVVGAAIGLLVCLAITITQRVFGASGGYCTLAGIAGKAIAPKTTQSLEYFRESPARLNWGTMLLFGLAIGAFFAAWTGNELTGRWLSPLWEAHFGNDSVLLRFLTAFAGGCLMAIGARLAGGCTSGNGISGTLQLSLGSWIAVAGFFLGGVATAMLLYRF